MNEDALGWLRAGDEGGELAAREATELLARAMRELSPAEQLVITLQELEGRSQPRAGFAPRYRMIMSNAEAEIAATLTPEQRERFRKFRKEHRRLLQPD